jgi:hypothetical protein
MLLTQVDLNRYTKEDFKRIATYIRVVKYPSIMDLIKNPDLLALISHFCESFEEMSAKAGFPIPTELKQYVGTTVSTVLLYGILAGEAKRSEFDSEIVH